MSVFWQNLWRRQKKKREGVSKNPWEKKANKNLSLPYKIATKIVPSDALTTKHSIFTFPNFSFSPSKVA